MKVCFFSMKVIVVTVTGLQTTSKARPS